MIFLFAWLMAAHAHDPNLEYLLRARRALPTLFTDASEHNIALGSVAREVEGMRRRFVGDTARRAYVTITITDGAAAARRVDARRLPALAGEFRRRAARSGVGGELDRARVLQNLARALREWHRTRGDESDALGWFRFAVWSEGLPRVAPNTPILNDADVAVFESARFFAGAYGRLRRELGVSRRRNDDLGRTLRWLARRARGDLLLPAPPARHETLTLAELTPELGALRGHPGSDCSSVAGPGYPFAPAERVFLILDVHGRARGYVSTTRVTVDGEARLYVNAIAGKRLNSRHVLMTLSGLDALARRADAAGLALPGVVNLWTCINYAHVRETLKHLTADAVERPVTFLDVGARAIIELASRKGYEAMHNTRTVVPIAAPPPFAVEVEDGSAFAALDDRPITPDEFAVAVVEWLANGRDRDDAALRGMVLDAGVDLARLVPRVLNVAGRPRAEYRRALEDDLFLLGVGAPRRLMTDRPELFAIGEIVAADALTPARRSETFDRLLRFVERQRAPMPYLLPEVIETWLASLTPENRDQLLVRATDRLLIKEAASENRRADVGVTTARAKLGHLIGRLLDAESLRGRALELVALGLPWRGLMAIAGYLDQDLNEIHFLHGAIIGTALGHAPTAADFNYRLTDLLTYLGSSYTPSHDAVHGCLLHLMSLRPTVAEVERTWTLLGRPASMKSLLHWLAREFGSAEEFARELPRPRGDELSELRLVAGVIASRIDEFYALAPDPAQIAAVERARTADCDLLLED